MCGIPCPDVAGYIARIKQDTLAGCVGFLARMYRIPCPDAARYFGRMLQDSLPECCGISCPDVAGFFARMLRETLPGSHANMHCKCYDYLMRKYRYMNMQNAKHKILHRNAYMRSIIGKGEDTPVKPQGEN